MKIIRRCLFFSSRLSPIQGDKDRGQEYFDLKIGIEKDKKLRKRGRDVSLISSIRFFFLRIHEAAMPVSNFPR